jgi:hypothetical protein
MRLPIVLADDRSLDFDRSALRLRRRAWTAWTRTTPPSCATGSCPGFGAPSYGLDSPHQRPFQRPLETVFPRAHPQGARVPGPGGELARSQPGPRLHPPHLDRAAEGAPGRGRRHALRSPARGGASTSVGPGSHQSRLLHDLLAPAVDARALRGRLVPPAPVARSDGPAQAASVLGKGAADSPPHRAGADFGVEAAVWDDSRSQRRITFELGGPAASCACPA